MYRNVRNSVKDNKEKTIIGVALEVSKATPFLSCELIEHVDETV